MSWDGMIVFLGTVDLEATDHFYREILGFELYKDQGLCRIYSVPGGGKIGFCSHLEPIYGDKSPIITFVTDKVDDFYERLSKMSDKVIASPKVNPRFDIYHFFTEDPSGYTVEIQKFI